MFTRHPLSGESRDLSLSYIPSFEIVQMVLQEKRKGTIIFMQRTVVGSLFPAHIFYRSRSFRRNSYRQQP